MERDIIKFVTVVGGVIAGDYIEVINEDLCYYDNNGCKMVLKYSIHKEEHPYIDDVIEVYDDLDLFYISGIL